MPDPIATELAKLAAELGCMNTRLDTELGRMNARLDALDKHSVTKADVFGAALLSQGGLSADALAAIAVPSALGFPGV